MLVLLSVSLFVVLFKPYEAFALLPELRTVHLLLGIALTLVALYGVRTLLWKNYFFCNQIDMPLMVIFSILTTTTFAGVFLPARASEPLSALLFHRQTGIGLAKLLGFALFERVLTLLNSLVIVYLYLLMDDTLVHSLRDLFKSVGNDSSSVVLVVLCAIGLFVLLFATLLRRHVVSFLSGCKDILLHPRLMITSILFSVLYMLTTIAGNYFYILSFPQDSIHWSPGGFAIIAFITSGSIVAGLISLLPTGLGPGEYSYAALLVLFGIPAATASSVVIVVVCLLYLLILGCFLLARWLGYRHAFS
ncbi:MAG: flippase-like domain-containing protein [Magnetococcales bacterium]|nr:flippase-like domain-containing protein [Magnetococcales bacterium]